MHPSLSAGQYRRSDHAGHQGGAVNCWQALLHACAPGSICAPGRPVGACAGLGCELGWSGFVGSVPVDGELPSPGDLAKGSTLRQIFETVVDCTHPSWTSTR